MTKYSLPALLLCLLLLISSCGSVSTTSAPVSDKTPTASETTVFSVSESSDASVVPTEPEKPSSETPTDAPSEVPTEVPTDTPTPQKNDDELFLESLSGMKYELTGEEKPSFTGRWFLRSGMTATFTDGSFFSFMTKNTSGFELNFTVRTQGETPFFSYSIDNAAPVRQQITSAHVDLPDNGRHLVVIYADGMCENENKWTDERGFYLSSVKASDENGQILGAKPTGKVIFYYGDSITEGVNALAYGSTSSHNSATNAYPYFCSKALNAVTYSIGYGASGIIMTGSCNTMMNMIDNVSKRRKVEDGILPDVIVVNHGTNDGSTSDADFEKALSETLAHLREKYPDVPIVYMIPFCQAKASVIRKVVKTLDNAFVVETSSWGITCTDGLHPDTAGAKKAGTNLAKQLKTLLGEDFFV